MLMSTFVEKFVIASPLENASFEYLPSILFQRKQRQEGLETSRTSFSLSHDIKTLPRF